MKPLVEHVPNLDVRRLTRLGGVVGVSWRWPTVGDLGGGTWSVSDDHVKGDYTLHEVVRSERLAICESGGSARYPHKWFKCPRCRKPCRFVYFRAFNWACRRCHDLAFMSQYTTHDDKLRSELYEVQRELRAGRPARMRLKTWNTKLERLAELAKLLKDAPAFPTRGDLNQEAVQSHYVRIIDDA